MAAYGCNENLLGRNNQTMIQENGTVSSIFLMFFMSGLQLPLIPSTPLRHGSHRHRWSPGPHSPSRARHQRSPGWWAKTTRIYGWFMLLVMFFFTAFGASLISMGVFVTPKWVSIHRNSLKSSTLGCFLPIFTRGLGSMRSQALRQHHPAAALRRCAVGRVELLGIPSGLT